MSKAALKSSVAAVVKTNGVEGINGANLQAKLFEIIDACYPTAQNILLTSSDFTTDTYQNDLLIGKTAGIDFELFTNTGSGVLLKVGNGYTFDSAYGIIVATAQDYKLKILK